MDEYDWLAEQFEAHRGQLRAVAYRMLGSGSGADDAVQEAWLHVSRSGATGVENLGGWLTTVLARVCLDLLRSRKSRPEEPLDEPGPDSMVAREGSIDPEQEVLLADSVGSALIVVLDMLDPAERIAFVLHDMFAVPFEEIAPIVGRSPTAARQLASRARRRLQGAQTDREADLGQQRKIVDAFLAASHGGDFSALLALLDPDVVLRADRTAVEIGSAEQVRGAAAVAGTFSGGARATRLALVDGAAALVWAPGGKPRVVFQFTIARGKIVEIELVADPARVKDLQIVILKKEE